MEIALRLNHFDINNVFPSITASSKILLINHPTNYAKKIIVELGMTGTQPPTPICPNTSCLNTRFYSK